MTGKTIIILSENINLRTDICEYIYVYFCKIGSVQWKGRKSDKVEVVDPYGTKLALMGQFPM